MSVLFDTLHYANNLKEAGVPAKQAEAQAELLKDVIEDQLVTKSHLDLRLAELKNEIIKWVLGVAIAQASIIIACLRFAH